MSTLRIRLVLILAGLAGITARGFESRLINYALLQYVNVIEVGQKTGWKNRSWFENTAIAHLNPRDRDYLWKEVNLAGPLLPATVTGTKLFLRNSDAKRRGTRITEVDYRDFFRGMIYVEGKKYTFDAFTTIEAMYQNEFQRAFDEYQKSASRTWPMPWREAHAAPGCTLEDTKMIAKSGLAASSIVQKFSNPTTFCTDLALTGGFAAHEAMIAPKGEKLSTFREGVIRGVTQDFRDIHEGLKYCKARAKGLTPSDGTSAETHETK